MLSAFGRCKREEKSGADHLHVILWAIAIALPHIEFEECGFNAGAQQGEVGLLLGVACRHRGEAQLAGDEERAFGGNGGWARVVELVIQRRFWIAMIPGLRRFDRLIAEAGEEETIRLV